MGFPVMARFAHPDAGYASTQELAARHLVPGRTYSVRSMQVGQSDSYLSLYGVDQDVLFSTCLFEPVYGSGGEPPGLGGTRVSTCGELARLLSCCDPALPVAHARDAEAGKCTTGAILGDALLDETGEAFPVPEDGVPVHEETAYVLLIRPAGDQ